MVSPSIDRRLGLNGNVGVKAPVLIAVTSNLTLNGEQTIQSVTTDESRVLVAGQTDATENGIYDTSTGDWTRSVDCNGVYDLRNGTLVSVAMGTYATTLFRCATEDTFAIGTDEIEFEQYAAPDTLAFSQIASYLSGDVRYHTQQIITAKSAGCDITGDCYTNLNLAIQFAATNGFEFHMTKGRAYQIATAISLPAGLKLRSHGAYFYDLSGTVSNTPFISVADDFDADILHAYIPTGKTRDRVIVITGQRFKIGKLKAESVDQQANVGDTSDSAIRIVTVDDWEVGRVEVSGYDHAFNIETCLRFKVGYVSVTNFVRGMWVFDCKNYQIHGGHIRTASINASLTAGNNAILLSCNSDFAHAYGTIADFTLENSGEHGMRIGGEYSHVGMMIVRPRVKDAGACGIKVLGTTASAPTENNECSMIIDPIVEDCGTSLSAGENRVGIMIEFGVNWQVVNPIVRKRANTYCASFALRLNGCTNITVTGGQLSDAQFDNLLLHAQDGSLSNITMHGVSMKNAARYNYNLAIDSSLSAVDVSLTGGNIVNAASTAVTLIGINVANAGTLSNCLTNARITSTLGSSTLVACNSNNMTLQITGATTTTTGVSAANGSWWQTGTALNYRSSATWVALV